MMIRNRPGITSKIIPRQAREIRSMAISSTVRPAWVLSTKDAARNVVRPTAFTVDRRVPREPRQRPERSGHEAGLDHEPPGRPRRRTRDQPPQQRMIEQTCG